MGGISRFIQKVVRLIVFEVCCILYMEETKQVFACNLPPGVKVVNVKVPSHRRKDVLYFEIVHKHLSRGKTLM